MRRSIDDGREPLGLAVSSHGDAVGFGVFAAGGAPLAELVGLVLDAGAAVSAVAAGSGGAGGGVNAAWRVSLS
jgi:hypothetical protein